MSECNKEGVVGGGSLAIDVPERCRVSVDVSVMHRIDAKKLALKLVRL